MCSSDLASLWQGVSGTNNPCPAGFRIPTEAEFNAEISSWGSQNEAGAYASPLKLTVAGYRDYSNGLLNLVNGGGFYWSNTINTTLSRCLILDGSTATLDQSDRARGMSVRCIKD